MSDPVWEKLNQHDKDMMNLQLKQARIEERIAIMDERIDRNQHELVEGLARIESKVDSTTQWMNESRGGLRFGKWLAGVSVAVFGGILAWLKFFKG